MVVLVVEPEDHRRVLGELDQQGMEAAQPVAPKHVDLLEDLLGLVELRVAGGEHAVPEEAQLLLQGPGGVDHSMDVVGLGAG